MDEKIELMYRQPDANNHQNIVEVLDEIILSMREIVDRLEVLEEATETLYTDSYGGTD